MSWYKDAYNKWRSFLDKSDRPADGLEPADKDLGAVHRGGLQSHDSLAPGEPDGTIRGAPIRNRPALQIDPEPIDYAPGQFDLSLAMDDLNKNRQNLRKSDHDQSSIAKIHDKAMALLSREWNVQNRELTDLEASPTLDLKDLETAKRRLAGFKELLAQADTVDVDLFRLKRSLDDIKNSIDDLKRS